MVDDWNRKTRECLKNNGNDESTKNYSKIDSILKLLMGHIAKYDSDAKTMIDKISKMDDNTKLIEKNKKEIDGENLAKLS